MSLQIILASYKSINIYDRSKQFWLGRFNIYDRSRDLTNKFSNSFIYTAWLNTHPHRSLYNCHEPNTIDEISLDTTRRTSIYQRARITDHITAFANNLGKYEFFKSCCY